MSDRPVRVILCNLRVSSKPFLVVPWLVGQLLIRRAHVACLQEVTAGHAKWLRGVPGWTLIGGAEALLVRTGLVDYHHVIPDMSPTWRGPHRIHPGRALPMALVRGWLDVGSLHFPPNWTNGAYDRRAAGSVMLSKVLQLAREPLPSGRARFLGGDINTPPGIFRRRSQGAFGVTGTGIDYAAHQRCRIAKHKRIGSGPGMDHKAVLMVVKPSW